MALIKLVSGGLREVWQESAQQGPGAEVVSTGIRIAASQLSRIQGILAIGAVVGAPDFQATPTVVGGFLHVTVLNFAAPGNSGAWVLDVMLTHSIQQLTTPADPGIILIVGGGLGTPAIPETLAQAYDMGAAPADQKMVLSNVKGGGVLIDGSTAAVTGNGVCLELRQNAYNYIPFVISRCIGGQSSGPVMQFNRAHGSFAAPANIVGGDELGTIDYYGRYGGAPNLLARIVSLVTSVAAGPDAAIDFYTAFHDVLVQSWEMWADGANNGVLTGFGNAKVLPAINNNGSVGLVAGPAWTSVAAYTINALANVCLGAGAVGGGANLTVMLPNTATLPAPQADQVYLGSQNWAGTGGNNHAALAISAEEPAGGALEPDMTIPIVYNGTPVYLLAVNRMPS
jgi:hypothetical protein